MTDAESLRRAADGAEVVVHLVSIRQGSDDDFRQVMEQGTRDLVAAAKDAGVRRFVLMSALGTSEETKDLVPYYRAKWEMEQTVQGSGVEHVVFRPSFVFAGDGGILPTFTKLARVAPSLRSSARARSAFSRSGSTTSPPTSRLGSTSRKRRTASSSSAGPTPSSWNEFWQRLKRELGQRRPSVHVPMGLMRLNALVTERLPGNIPLTRDLLTMLEHGDNVASNDDAARTFGLPLAPLDEQLRRAT